MLPRGRHGSAPPWHPCLCPKLLRRCASYPPLQADALGALHSLCQLSRSRQEQAAEQKAAGPLVSIAMQQVPPAARAQAQAASQQQSADAAAAAWAASRGLAVSLLCAFGGLAGWGAGQVQVAAGIGAALWGTAPWGLYCGGCIVCTQLRQATQPSRQTH